MMKSDFDKMTFERRFAAQCVRENALNRLCLSLETEENQRRFRSFPEAYCHCYGLNRDETHAVTDLDIPRLLKLGGELHRLAILTRVFNMDVRELWSQQTGLGVDELNEASSLQRVLPLR